MILREKADYEIDMEVISILPINNLTESHKYQAINKEVSIIYLLYKNTALQSYCLNLLWLKRTM